LWYLLIGNERAIGEIKNWRNLGTEILTDIYNVAGQLLMNFKLRIFWWSFSLWKFNGY